LVGAGFIPARKEPIVPPIPALESFNLGKRTLDNEKDNNFNPTVQVGIKNLVQRNHLCAAPKGVLGVFPFDGSQLE
jgi:hypothetical protein